MSNENLEAAIKRAMSDESFRKQLIRDPEEAAKSAGLSADDLAALMSGDSSRLRALGVSEQLSRFTLIEI